MVLGVLVISGFVLIIGVRLIFWVLLGVLILLLILFWVVSLRVKVSFTDGAGYAEAVYSDFTSPVAAAVNSPASGKPTVSDTTPRVGDTLAVDTSGVRDSEWSWEF